MVTIKVFVFILMLFSSVYIGNNNMLLFFFIILLCWLIANFSTTAMIILENVNQSRTSYRNDNCGVSDFTKVFLLI